MTKVTTAMQQLMALQQEVDDAVSDFAMEDFGKFGDFSMFNSKDRWHVSFKIGAGGAAIKWEHWGNSIKECMVEINRKVREFFDGKE